MTNLQVRTESILLPSGETGIKVHRIGSEEQITLSDTEVLIVLLQMKEILKKRDNERGGDANDNNDLP